MKEYIKNYQGKGIKSATYTKGYGKYKKSFKVYYNNDDKKYLEDKQKYESKGWSCFPYYL